MLEIKNLTKKYQYNVLSNISFTVNKGEFITVLGPSGTGKSTLLNCISGFDTEFSGDILLNQNNVNKVPSNKRNIGMVFQNYSLFPHMTAIENVEFPLKIKKMSSSIPAMRMLDKLGLTAHYYKYPKQLSGGQQQRVALARAFVYKPDLILLDEPLGSLDLLLRNELQNVIKNLHKEEKNTFIYVTHDITEAFYLSDKILLLNNGEIQQFDTPLNIYKYPQNDFVKEFIHKGLQHITKLHGLLT